MRINCYKVEGNLNLYIFIIKFFFTIQKLTRTLAALEYLIYEVLKKYLCNLWFQVRMVDLRDKIAYNSLEMQSLNG